MTVHFSQGHFEIIVIQNQKCCSSTLSITRHLKILYYVLFTRRAVELEWRTFSGINGDMIQKVNSSK
jgi:hypothetical protein